MLVDDDPRLLLALKETILVRMPSADIHTSSSSRAAVDQIRTRDYDVIVSDVRMPELSGIELLERVRSLSPDSPVILITGADSEQMTLKALRGGAYDFISKPVDPVYLVFAIERAVEARQLRREVDERRRALQRYADQLERIVEQRTHDLTQANRMKDEFLATVSHELRTPLTPILGWARLLKAGRLDETSKTQALEAIERNARAQAQLVDDLLDVSRIVTGKLRLDRQTVELGRILSGAVDNVGPSASAKNVKLVSDFDSLELGNISGDAKRLQQVFWNLLSNALKFTPTGGMIRVCGVREGDDVVRIEVSDTGCGIHRELLPYVFDRFRQGDISASRAGLGLGLSIVRHLVELHGGSVQAKSDGIDKGSSFAVTLPVGDLVEPPPPSLYGRYGRTEDQEPSKELVGVKVLLVEDSLDTKVMLSAVLFQAGAFVKAVSAPKDALAALQAGSFDVLLCDIGLGEEQDGGYDLIKQIRKVPSEQGGAIPAIALTALAKPEDRKNALHCGFQLHLAKPGPADLPRIIAQLLNRLKRVPVLTGM